MRGDGMQFNGIGNEHGAEMHHVTNCMHDHSHYRQDMGGAKAAAGNMSAQAVQESRQQAEGQFSLSAWLEKTLGRGKGLLRHIWGTNEPGGAGEPGDKAGAAQVLAQVSESRSADSPGMSAVGLNIHQPDMAQTLHAPQVAAAASAVPPQNSQGNPYFAAVEDTGSRQENLWQKVRVKFRDITGQLAGHLPGKFMNAQTKGSFQAKQERPKEDLRRRSKYRRDELEIDCVLMDDSYLLDSYDKKGEYSKLSTKK
jgi:hypothetical protein